VQAQLEVSRAQAVSAQATVKQREAALAQAQVDLDRTDIRSPVDGVVIKRSVDVGQTVAASLQAPTLFTLAADLEQMQLSASIDESDVASIKEGQTVGFRVDAYPNESFTGIVKQVRLNPTIEQNVVTYAAIVTTRNPDLKLKPGMTASLSVEVARRDGVLRVPSSALRFRPSAAVLKAIGGPGAAATTAAGVRPVATSGVAGDMGTIWSYENGHLAPVAVTIGLSDSQYTEIRSAAVHEGAQIATQAVVPGASSNVSTPRPATSNPLLGQTPVRRM
jgi:HlyD family secretion protein